MISHPGLSHALHTAASPVISSVLTHGGNGVAAPTGEVSAVAAMTLAGVPQLAAAWSPVLKPLGFSIAITGVFCHSVPMVSFHDSSGISRTCELGDLLIVVDDKSSSAHADRRAVLIQAKVYSTSGLISTSGTAAHQLDLYEHWHRFTFTSPGYPSNRRDFHACTLGATADSGRYGGIELKSSPRAWDQVAPAAGMRMGGGPGLSEYLAEAIVGAAGREAVAGATDPWSETVDDLLSITAGQTFGHASLGGARPRRGTQAFAMQIPDIPDDVAPRYAFRSQVVAADLPPQGPPEFGVGRGDWGISFIHIEIRTAER